MSGVNYTSIKDKFKLKKQEQDPGSVEGKATRFQTDLARPPVLSWPVGFRNHLSYRCL